jgi:hypothetical protein
MMSRSSVAFYLLAIAGIVAGAAVAAFWLGS